MTTSDIRYVILFVGTFPALWILAALIDYFLPDSLGHHSPREEQGRQERQDRLS